MFRKIIPLFKRKIKEIKYPKNSFSRKFYKQAKDLKIEHFFIKIGSDLILIKSGSRSKCEIGENEFKKILKEKVKDFDSLKRATMIHNHSTTINTKYSLIPSKSDINTFFNLYRKYGITNFMINFIDLKTKTEFGRLHLILESKYLKKKLDELKKENEYNQWSKNIFDYIDEIINTRLYSTFLKELLRKTGFRLRYKGLNGYKYNFKTEIFEKSK
jgi:hypothetical protein